MTGPINWLAEYERHEEEERRRAAAHPLVTPSARAEDAGPTGKPDWLAEFSAAEGPRRLPPAVVMAEPPRFPIPTLPPAVVQATPPIEQPFTEPGGGGASWDDSGEGFLSNLGSGLYRGIRKDLPEQVGNVLQMFGGSGLNRDIPGTVLPMAGRALEQFGNEAPDVQPRVGTIGEAVQSPSAARDYLGYQIGNVGASSLPSLLAAIVGGPIGATAASYVQNTGDVRQELEDSAPNTEPSTRDAIAALLGVPLAALDQVTESRLGGKVAKAIGGKLATSAAERGVVGTAKRVAKEVGKSTLSEGVTEAAQEGVQYLGVRGATGQPIKARELGSRMLEAGVAGAVGGGAMGGATETVAAGTEALRSRLKPRQAEPPVTPAPIVDADGRDRSMLDARLAKREEHRVKAPAPEIDHESARAVLDRRLKPKAPTTPDELPIAPYTPHVEQDNRTEEEKAAHRARVGGELPSERRTRLEREAVTLKSGDVVVDEQGQRHAFDGFALQNEAHPDDVTVLFGSRRENGQMVREFIHGSTSGFGEFEIERKGTATEPAKAPEAKEQRHAEPAQAGITVTDESFHKGKPAFKVLRHVDDTGKVLGELRLYMNEDGTSSGQSVFIEKEHQRKGIGTALYREAERLGFDPLSNTGKSSPLTEAGRALTDKLRAAKEPTKAPPPKKLEINPDSRYAGEENPEALFDGSVEQARAHYNDVLSLNAVLDSGKKANGRKLTPKEVTEARTLRQQRQDLYQSTLGEIESAFGKEGRERAKSLIVKPAPTPPSERAPSKEEAKPEAAIEEEAPKAPTPITKGTMVRLPDGRVGRVWTLKDNGTAEVRMQDGGIRTAHVSTLKTPQPGDAKPRAVTPQIVPDASKDVGHVLPSFVNAQRRGGENPSTGVANASSAPDTQSGDDAATVAGTTGERADDTRPVRESARGESQGEPSRGVSSPATERDAGERGGGDRPGSAADVRVDAGRAPEAAPADRDVPRASPADRRTRAAGEGAGDGGRDRSGARPGEPDAGGAQRRPAESKPERRDVGSNYRLTDADAIGAGGAKGKARGNLAAIRLLKEIEREGRPATAEEQATLVKYVGWGGIPQAFSPDNKDFGPIAKELRELLTDEEYAAARASTLNAHYTSAPVIRAIHAGLARLGLTTGRALEPSMGVGHFLGLGPTSLQWTGVELDSITGRLAKLLYPQSDVQVRGFETVAMPDNLFDVAVGNVPFGNFGVTDRAYPKEVTGSIHDYFFAKSLDKVRPGGLVAFITSSFTLDKQSAAMRKYLGERANLVAAIRLPNTAFAGNAGTEVTTDLIVLQKREKGTPQTGETFVDRAHIMSAGESMFVNEYYARHPEMMLGEMQLAGTMYRDKAPTLVAPEGQNIEKALGEAFAKLPAGIYKPRAIEAPGTRNPGTAEAELVGTDDDIREGGFLVRGGRLLQREGNEFKASKLGKAAAEKVSQLVGIRDAIHRVLQSQFQNRSDEEITAERAELNRLYDRFVKAHGPIRRETRTEINREGRAEPIVVTRYPNLRDFQADPRWPLLMGLEEYDAETDTAKKTDILQRRVIEPRKPVEKVDTPADAIPVVLAESGAFSLERVAQLSGTTIDAAREALRGAIYENPTSGVFETRDQYLSGNVRTKLAQAQRAAKGDPRFNENVEALKGAIPEDLPPSKIGAQLGAPWIPTETIAQFVRDVFGAGNVKVTYLAREATWSVSYEPRQRSSAASTTEFGTKRAYGTELLSDALNLKPTTIYDPGPDDTRVKNVQETLAAQEKQQKLKDRFATWLWEDGARATALARLYNDSYNSIRLRDYDGAHLTMPGAASHVNGKPFGLRPHQKNAIWRILQSGNTLLAHVVGSGKTYTMVAAGMEAKRLGLARKPMYAIPNHMLGQFSREFLGLYPTAKLLVATKEDFAKDRRKAFTARIASENWDAIIMTHRSFESVGMSPEFEQQFLERELGELEQSIREAKAAKNHDLTKLIEKAKKKRTARLDTLRAAEKKDDLLPFEALGVDMLFVDEADEFKNLNITSKQQGLGLEGSQRAFDMYMKTQYLDSLNPGRGVVFATGTPIANSVSEMYTMQRYLQPRLMGERSVSHFDGWSATFGQMVTGMELAPDGSGYRQSTRFARFQNMGELAQMFRSVADVQTSEMLNLPRPKLETGQAQVVAVPATSALKRYVQTLVERARKVKNKEVEPDEDNLLKITGDGRKAALDLRLVGLSGGEGSKTKVVEAASKIARIYKETTALKGAQMVFSDLGTPSDKFNVYDELRLHLEREGVKPAEIRYIHDADTQAKKDKLFADVKAGRVRVVIGSTQKLGAGTNVQDRLVALHHLDAPWRPRDVEQRNGRILRQGNLLYGDATTPDSERKIPHVSIFTYVTEGSFDAYIWQGLERKAGFITQALTAGVETREIDDVGTVEVDWATAKAIASGNPKVLEKATIDAQVSKLERLRRAHQDDVFGAGQKIKLLPMAIAESKERATALQKDVDQAEDTAGDRYAITIGGKKFTKRADAGAELKKVLDAFLGSVASVPFEERKSMSKKLGTFAGFPLHIEADGFSITAARMILNGEAQHVAEVTASDSPMSLALTLEHAPKGIATRIARIHDGIEQNEKNLARLKELVGKPYEHAAKLAQLKERQAALDTELQADATRSEAEAKKGGGMVDDFLTSEEGALKIGELGDRLRQRRLDREPLAVSQIEEVEERFQRAKGIATPTIRDRVRQAIDAVKRAGRHFPHMDPSSSPLAARTNELLLEVEHAKRYAEAMAYDKIAAVTDGLTQGEVDLFTRKLVLDDLMKDVEAGLYEGRDELPFGYPDAAAVQRDLDEVEGAAASRPKVQRAIAERQRFAQALTRALVDAEQLNPKVLEDERYYHRQVLDHFNALAHGPLLGLGGREARIKRKGFQKQRVGGGDFNTRYQEAEFEWVAQAYRILHMVGAQKEIRRLADIQPQLKGEAKSLNLSRYYEKEAAAAGIPDEDMIGSNDPLQPFRKRMGMASSKILSLATQGKLDAPQYDAVIEAMAEAHAEWKAEMKERDPDDREPFRFDHPRYFALLNYLASNEGPGAMPARSFFKAMHEREQAIRETLGTEYKEWEDVIPEGYTKWQPVKGQFFYPALTVQERALDAALEGSSRLDEALRSVLVLGGPKETWVIPDYLAATMDKLGQQRDMSAVEATWVGGMRYWKTIMLQAPTRILKYIFNNTSGDLDASIMYPKVLKYGPGAARDLFTYMVKRQGSDALKREMQEATRLRVIDQGLTVAEIPDVNELPAFERLVASDPLHFMGLVQSYFKHARLVTQLRENILRLAAWRHFRAELQAGRSPGFGASNPASVNAQTSPAGKAAVLARDLLGDYGAVSSGGMFIRDRAIPFYSWIEINAKRYVNLFRNISKEGHSGGRLAGAGAARLAVAGAGVVFRANVFFLLVNLWNHLLWPDEEDELRGTDARTLHLILGRDDDGRVRTVRIEGAFADFLEWVNLSDYPSDIADLVKGTKSLADQFVEGAEGPINRVINSWEPVTKTAAELLTGRSMYPNAFKPRVVRDRGGQAARAVTLGWLYDKVTDKPMRPGNLATDLLLYRTDPGEAAYFRVREKAGDWLEQQNKGRNLGNPTKKENALYYWRKSLQWGEPEKAERWLQRYYALGGTRKSAVGSIKRAAPLSPIAVHDRRRFLASLTPEERESLTLAEQWYQRTYHGVRPSRPAAASDR